MKNLIKDPYFTNINKKSLPLFILLIALTLTSILFTSKVAKAATFPWVQNNWSGGLDGGASFPSHQLPNSAFSGWTKFSTSTSLTVSTSTITLAPTPASVSKMPFNDFVNGTNVSTIVTGTGTSSNIQLKTSSQLPTGSWDTPSAPPTSFYASGNFNNLGQRHAVYVNSTTTGASIYTAGGDNGFWRYSIDNDTWTKIAISTAPSWWVGTSLMYPGSGDYIYILSGGGTNFYKYSITNDQFTTVASTGSVSDGGDGVYSPDNNLFYVIKGGNSNYFYTYSTSTGWASISGGVYGNVGAGGSMVYAGQGSNALYVIGGNNTTNFWKYSISSPTSGTWSTPATPKFSMGTGGASVYVNSIDGPSIYVLGGNNTTNFARYSINDNVWYTATSTGTLAIPNAPDTVSGGSSLVYSGGDYIYAFQGVSGNYHSFWRYSISRRAWDSLKANPVSQGNATSIVFSTKNPNYLYERDGWSNAFWQYSLSDNTWTQKAGLLLTPSGNGSNFVYASSTDSIYMFPAGISGATSTNEIWKYSTGSDKWSVDSVSP